MRSDTLLTKRISWVKQVKKSSSQLLKGKGLDRCVFFLEKKNPNHNRYFITMPLERNQPLRCQLHGRACKTRVPVTEQRQHRVIHHSSLTICSSLQCMPYVCPVPTSAAKPVSSPGPHFPKRFGKFPSAIFDFHE